MSEKKRLTEAQEKEVSGGKIIEHHCMRCGKYLGSEEFDDSPQLGLQPKWNWNLNLLGFIENCQKWMYCDECKDLQLEELERRAMKKLTEAQEKKVSGGKTIEYHCVFCGKLLGSKSWEVHVPTRGAAWGCRHTKPVSIVDEIKNLEEKGLLCCDECKGKMPKIFK